VLVIVKTVIKLETSLLVKIGGGEERLLGNRFNSVGFSINEVFKFKAADGRKNRVEIYRISLDFV